MRCDRYRIGMFAALVGVVLFAAAATFLFYELPSIIRRKINEQTYLGYDRQGKLTNTTLKWISPEFTFKLQVWTFSIENEAAVMYQGAKPNLTEKGPYTFDEYQNKTHVTFTANNTRVLYRNKRTYFFNQSSSCYGCFLNDTVTIPNIVLQKLLDAAASNFFARITLDTILQTTGTKLFVRTTVGELLFDGYRDPILNRICGNAVIAPLCHAIKIPSRIGLFYKKNGTEEGQYEIDSGVTSVDLIGKVYSYDGQRQMTNAWYKPWARMLNGTDGQLYPPGFDQHDSSKLELFIGQICRTVEMEYTTRSIFKGLPAYHYKPSRAMRNVRRERALGFCNPKTPVYFENTYIQEHGCAPAGLMDMSSCLPGEPRAYVSQPHFLNSNPALAEALTGMREPSEDEDTVIGIEPSTGVVLFAQQHTQLNFGLTNGSLSSFAKFYNRIVPIIWLNDSAVIDEDTRSQLLQVYSIQRFAFWGGIVGYALVLVCAVLVVALFIIRVQRYQAISHEPLNNIEDDALSVHETQVTLPQPAAQEDNI